MTLMMMVINIATLLLALCAAFFAVRMARRPLGMPADQWTRLRGQIDMAIRTETDRFRSESAEQARAARQEIADNIRGFQTSVMEAFRTLSDPLQDQMRALNQTLNAGNQTSEERSRAISQRIEDALLRLATSAAEAQSSLRSQIDTRLEQFGEK